MIVSFASFDSLVSCSRVYTLFTSLFRTRSLDSFCGGTSSAGKINLRFFLIFVGVSWGWWSTGQCWTGCKLNKHHNDSDNNYNSFILLWLSSNNCNVYFVISLLRQLAVLSPTARVRHLAEWTARDAAFPWRLLALVLLFFVKPLPSVSRLLLKVAWSTGSSVAFTFSDFTLK